jgi:exodeoxyribonuclease V alpha subunit
MTELFEPTGEHDWRLSPSASGLLKTFNDGLLLTSADLHVATRLGALGGEDDERVLLAVAAAVRAVRRGSVCLALGQAAGEAPELPWPDPVAWTDALRSSPLVDLGVLRLDGELLYLDRYHRLETQVRDDLVARASQPPPLVDEARLAAAIARVRGGRASDEQMAAAESAVRGWTTILTGGPGTGKTTTVARVLALLADQALGRGERLSVALSAPTGKAASRLQEAVVGELSGLSGPDGTPEAAGLIGRPQGVTLHRLLGWRPDNATRFKHDRANRLKHDVVVVDESSMVELTMMARLLEALRPDSRLLLVGDPRQLTSVGAGAVLGDLVRGYSSSDDSSGASPVVELTTNFRSERDIESLAEALRGPAGGEPDADDVLEVLRTPSDQVSFVEAATDDEIIAAIRPTAVEAALRVRERADAEDAVGALDALDRHRLLCAHREGPFGVHRWNALVERWLAEEAGPDAVADLSGRWYLGRPLLVTNNDYALDVYNGETGVVVRRGDRRRVFVAGAGATGLRDFAPGRLDAVETMHAMTIHKAQGSQADEVTVLLPEEGSRLLTRELFYTAVTRAKEHVRVVGTEAAVRTAITRQARRASGLRQRLLGSHALTGQGTASTEPLASSGYRHDVSSSGWSLEVE